jgi:hypothetical protein
VKRTPAPELAIVYDGDGRMTVKSIDLGFIQRNVDVVPDFVTEPSAEAMKLFVDGMFSKYPRLARADTAAEDAYELFLERGFSPWYAYKPGTEGFKIKKRYGAKAIGNYLLRTQVGRMEIDGGKYPKLDFDSEVVTP